MRVTSFCLATILAAATAGSALAGGYQPPAASTQSSQATVGWVMRIPMGKGHIIDQLHAAGRHLGVQVTTTKVKTDWIGLTTTHAIRLSGQATHVGELQRALARLAGH